MREIPGFPNYMVTEYGQVWSMKNNHWLSPCDNGVGYLYVCLCIKGQIKHKYIHRLVLEAFVGPGLKGMECRHKDGDSTNNRLNNLRWGTRSENHRDAVKHGTSPFGNGEQNHSVKLTETQVRFIFNAYHNKTHRPGELAKRFGISIDHVSRIARKERWGHLWDE